MSAAGIVFWKELRDALRDRRTAFMVLGVAILMGPVTLVLFTQFLSGLEQKAATLRVRIAGAAHAPALVNFLQRNDVEIENAPDDYEKRIREGTMDAVIVVREDFDERFLAGDQAKVELVYDDSRTDAGAAIRTAQRLLRAFNRETGMLRMIARGVSAELAEPVKVDNVNTATPRQRAALLLFLIPMFAIMSPLLGGMTVAIDSTAGERERGSLEPLLGNPVPLSRIVIGKWLAAWTFASGVGVLTLGGFAVTASLYAQRKLAAAFAFGAPELADFIVVMVPFAAMTAALQMLICTYGRSYREAQTYVSFLVTAVSFVPLIAIYSGVKDAFWQLVVPALGQQMVLGRIIRGDVVPYTDYLIPAALALAIAAICLAGVTRLHIAEALSYRRLPVGR